MSLFHDLFTSVSFSLLFLFYSLNLFTYFIEKNAQKFYSVMSPFSLSYFTCFLFSRVESKTISRAGINVYILFCLQHANSTFFFFNGIIALTAPPPPRQLYGIPHYIKSNTEHIKSFDFLSSHQHLCCIV